MPTWESDLANGAGKPLPCGSEVHADSSDTINNKDHRPNKPVLGIIRAAFNLNSLIIPRDASVFGYNSRMA